ncbi:MAG TPA: hypothetical protein VN903_05160 [Polyangia bacterium]|nr:hypothetical protein [Polyangia bacterium]
MGFDSVWRLVDIAGYRADPTPAATIGEIWRRAAAGAPWASELELPDRHDIGLLMQLEDVARRDPTCQAISADAIGLFRRDDQTAEEGQLVLKLLNVKAEGSSATLVGPRTLNAVSRLAAAIEESLAADETPWTAATEYVERPTFDAFLVVLKGLPPERVLMTMTF